MAIRTITRTLMAGSAAACLGVPQALAQQAGSEAVDCIADPANVECTVAAGAGSTYLTPLVVSTGASAGGVGDPYATPAAVSTIGAEEINQFGGQNVDNVLRTQPGTFTRDSPQNPGVAVNIRGLEGSGRVNMEIDGARQNFRFTGHEAQGFTYVDPALLAGIDITRGGTAGPGGAGALAGVAQFRTLSVDDLLADGKDFGGFTSITAGTNGAGLSEAAAAAFRFNEGFAVLGAISKRNTGTYENGDGVTVPFTEQDILSGLLKAEITPSADQKLTLSGLVYHDAFTANSYDQEVLNQTYTARYDFTPLDNELIDLHAQLYRNDTRMEYGTNPSSPSGGAAQGRIIEDAGWGGRIYNTSRGTLGDTAWKSTYGFEYSADDVDVLNTTLNGSTGINPNGSGTIGGAFAETTVSVGIVDLTGGLRYDFYTVEGQGTTNPLSSNPLGTPAQFDLDRSEGRLNPSARIALNATDWLQPYVSYAETFRAPTINEMLAGGEHPSAPTADPGLYLPNPDLVPEVARTWEIGANIKLDDWIKPGDSLRFKANYFSSEIDNYITAMFGPGVPAGPPFYYYYEAYFGNNPGTSSVRGIELQAAYDAGNVFGSLSYTHTETDLPAQENGFGASSYLPDDILSATLGLRLLDQQQLTVGGRITAVSDNSHEVGSGEAAEGYSLVDLFANYKFDNGVELGVNVSNLFDTSYTPALSYTPSASGIDTGRGRTIEFTAKATF